jgi:hypothetical protein
MPSPTRANRNAHEKAGFFIIETSSGFLKTRGDIEMNMEKIKWILLAVYLILAGLALLGVSLGGGIMNTVAGICAVIAGILFLIDR